MSWTTDWIDELKAEAEALKKGIGDIEFSDGTYQVQVVEGANEYWPFLQFGPKAQLTDAFCTCDRADEGKPCAHIAAAILAVMAGQTLPLHVRFAQSLWNALCALYGERQGYDPSVLKVAGPGRYSLSTVTGKEVFTLEAKTPAMVQRLSALIERRVPETEETSLKFSGLSYEELTLWREGRPSQALRYELSFWSDLAKLMMICQERGPGPTVAFGYAPNGIPNEITADFEPLKVQFYVSEANWPLIIPMLNSVKTPLQVHSHTTEAIEAITYDRETGALHIQSKSSAKLDRALTLEEAHQRSQAAHMAIGNWLFFPGDGFYSREQHTLLSTPTIPPEAVGQILTDHSETIAAHLTGETVHTQPVRPNYEIAFDESWNLHLSTYLFTPGDLRRGEGRFFSQWAYLPDDGFYPLTRVRFDALETVIPAAKVTDFVHKHRVWLNEQKGFRTHLTAVEAYLTYTLTPDEALVFESSVEMPEGVGETHDCGDWIYIAGSGFYASSIGRGRSAVKAGMIVPREGIPLFISLHRDDLELVRGFFNSRCPIIAAALDLKLKGLKTIKIVPTYQLSPEVAQRSVHYFGEYVYVEGEGFAEIPSRIMLPERFREPITLSGAELELFLTYELERLSPYLGKVDPHLSRPIDLKLVASGAAIKGSGLLSLELSYGSGYGNVPLTEVWKAIGKKGRFLFTAAGLLDLSDPRYSWLKALSPGRVERTTNTVSLTTLEFMRLNAVESLEVAPEATEVRKLLEALTHFTPPALPDLHELKSTLRPYQELGVQWLWFLYSYQLSGLLCDDMGLGKTHQAMALLAAVQAAYAALPPEEQPQFLVVCPTSVIYSWQEKLAQFLPKARVYTYYGAARTLEHLFEYDIVLTSYGTLRLAREELSRITFEVVIYDEIQVAKNGSSQTHAALSLMKGRMRIGLTGTPIENDLRELKSLFDLVLPTYFPSDSQFKEAFAIPIERDGDITRRDLLKRIINPFVLRRKKDEVLLELPEKVEERSHCDLAAEQRVLYNGLIEQSRAVLLRELQETDKPLPYTHIFALLTGLKRICDHPAVFLKSPEHFRNHMSGKWDLFVELLSQAQESQQKVVVFSQYLEMLDIIEKYLTESQIGFAAIRGSTLRRDEQLMRFQTDPKCAVFVGSLQAAGLGIDLTAASVVIHYDRWWTKAREDQATDRVHRIGQTRGVQVFKLLTLNTIEEKIDQIIERKGKLLEEIVGTDEKQQLKSFTREELIELLTHTH